MCVSTTVDDLLGRLLIYSMVLPPSVAVVWAWLRWYRHTGSVSSLPRRFLAVVSLVALSVSALTLALFPDVLKYFAGRPYAPWDETFVRAIRLGFWCTALGTPLAFFATGLVRVLLAIAGTLLIGFWILVGQGV